MIFQKKKINKIGNRCLLEQDDFCQMLSTCAQHLSSGRVNVLEARSGYMSHKDPHEIWLKQPLRVVAFKEIKADIMYLSLEPVTLRTWCLELNIYDSNITTQLLIFTWANLKCQISSLNFKAGFGQRGCADIMKRCWNHSGLLLMGPWLMVYWWAEWSVTQCQQSAWKRVGGIQLEKIYPG